MLSRIWNRRVSGLPMAGVLFFRISLTRLANALSTLFWRGNLKAMGRGSSVQAGVLIRHPGAVSLGAGCSLASGVSLTSELATGSFTLGNRSQLNSGVSVDFSGGVTIGDNVVISEETRLYSHSHGRFPKSDPVATPLVIGDNIWIGSRVMILEGVGRIGHGSIVAAGSVVTKEVPDGVVVAGVPARVVDTNPSSRGAPLTPQA